MTPRYLAGVFALVIVLALDLSAASAQQPTATTQELVDGIVQDVIGRTVEAACQEVIERYEGHVAQLLGDGVLAYFGYPVAHEHDVACWWDVEQGAPRGDA